MYKSLEFSNNFKKKMLLLAVITGIIIAISMPLNYIKLLSDYEKLHANQQSQSLAQQLQKYIKENPELWQYSSQKFTEVFSKHEKEGLVSVNVYDNEEELIFGQNYHTKHYFLITGTAPIVYNNKTFGYVYINYKIDQIIMTTALIFIGFILLGGIIGWMLYRFPARIVSRAQEEIINSFKNLTTYLIPIP